MYELLFFLVEIWKKNDCVKWIVVGSNVIVFYLWNYYLLV